MQPIASTARPSRQRHWLYAVALASLISPAATAQQPQFRTSAAQPASATEGLTTLPYGAYADEPAVGVPHRTLFRDTGAPYTNSLRHPRLEPSVHAGSVDAQLNVGLPHFNLRLPHLRRGFEPEEADLKLGPVYFDLHSLGVGLLYSDNINLSERHRDEDIIGMVYLSGTLLAQLTEGFQIAATGTLVYLPFQNDIGIAGFGLQEAFSYGLGPIPELEAQVAWDTTIAGWPVLIADEFRVGLGQYSVSSRDDFELFEGGRFDEEARAGHYVFRAPIQPENEGNYEERDSEFIYFSNTVSASTERLLPGEIRLRARAYNENLWYNQGRRGLPDLRRGADVALQSERENTRFKPFVTYQALYTDLREGVSHTIRLGVQGPITEQLDFYGHIGLFYWPENDIERVPWRITLNHAAGPYTQQALDIGSELGGFNDEYYTNVSYRIRQVLGPNLFVAGFFSYGTVEDLLGELSSREEIRTGVQFSASLGPKTRLIFGGTYSRIDWDQEFGLAETWTGRSELSYHFADTLQGRLLYQYQKRDASRENQSYYENLLFLTLTKYFR